MVPRATTPQRPCRRSGRRLEVSRFERLGADQAQPDEDALPERQRLDRAARQDENGTEDRLVLDARLLVLAGRFAHVVSWWVVRPVRVNVSVCVKCVATGRPGVGTVRRVTRSGGRPWGAGAADTQTTPGPPSSRDVRIVGPCRTCLLYTSD